MNTRPCPECGTEIAYNARSCTCGWGGRSARTSAPVDDFTRAQQAAERKQMLAGIESVATESARKWLEDHHIVARTVRGPERRAKLRVYIARLKQTPKPDSLDWAWLIKTDYIDGVWLAPIQIAMAAEALGEIWENRECKPRLAA